MRIAAIDMGTNTFHLIIGERYFNDIKILHKENSPVRLGEKTINDGIINEDAINRALVTLKNYKTKVEAYDVKKVRIMATSAVRSANNGNAFIQKVKQETGFEIEIISGDTEATFIYNAVKLSGSIEGMSLIMDIGGGSTEFLIADEQQIYWKKSYDLGASRMWQRYFLLDPLPFEDNLLIQSTLKLELKELFDNCKKYNPSMLIGSAGAFESYYSIINSAQQLEKNYEDIHLVAFKNLSCMLSKSNHEERSKIKGLIPLRVDMIVAASLLTNLILEETQIQKLRATSFDLKMGILDSI
ncbi:exopolyphosphatase [Pedobacter flavus]|uniref:Exopolyphosphatase n=1 Tax=Pedobacter flavus TaxID=3113906 RepID=A0ABU7H5X1_9SPHI|nr:exopolyphosphatase [Pedobacter sp. VNH31]MEE1885961.1 exopolyphosphatase [Pedobacter sp. VNH31]